MILPEDIEGEVPQWDDLATALFKGDVLLVKTLVEASSPDLAGPSGLTPLLYAIANGREKMVDLLLELGADPLSSAPGIGSPATVAASRHEPDLIEQLIDAGLDPNARDTLDRPLLHIATAARASETMVHLIERGADIDALDADGCSCVRVAGEVLAFDLILLLMEKGADARLAGPDLSDLLMCPSLVPGSQTDLVRQRVLNTIGKRYPGIRGVRRQLDGASA